MKKLKGFSLFLVTVFLVNILSLCTVIPVSAATESAAYVIADFEDGTINNTDSNSYSLVDGPGVAQKALKVANGTTLPAFDFGLRSQTTYSDAVWKYNASMWIRADEAVTSDAVDLVFTLKNTESAGFSGYVPETLTETISIPSAGLVTGEWVKVSKTFTYDGTTVGEYKKYSWSTTTTKDYVTAPTGTVQVKVGGGIAYTIDDLVIMPDKYTPHQTKTQNPILTTKIDGMASVTASSTPWAVANATSSEFTTTYQGTTVNAFGENNTIGKALKLTNTDYYTELVYKASNFKFGTEYTVEFMAKAENADAVNMRPRVILTYYKNGDENLGEWSQFPAYSSSPDIAGTDEGTLADGWKKFKVNVWINKVTQVETKTNVCFRLYGDNEKTAQWSIANVDMYPTKSVFTNLSAVNHFKGSRMSDGAVQADLSTSLMTGQYKAFEGRLELPLGDDYVIYKRYRNAENKDSFIYSGAEIENARLVTNICDKDNYFSDSIITPIEIKATGLTAVAEIDQTVWAADMPKLTATVRYNDASGTETLMAMCAMYDKNGKMLSHDVKDLEISEGEGEVKLSMDTVSGASNATVYLWEEGTLSPRLDKGAQITKTETGNFIYVDAVKGNSNTTYGYANPVKTVNQAVSAASSVSGNGKDTYIILMPGRQPVTSEVAITDAMTDESCSLTFVSYDKNDKGIISGANDISGKFSHYENGIWRAAVVRGMQTRQLYVNGVMTTKARTRDLNTTDIINTSVRNPSNVHQLQTLGVLQTSSPEFTVLKNAKRPADLEFVFFSYWTMNRCQVSSITDNGDGSISFNMDSLGWHSLNTQYNAYARTPSYIENAYEFIDEPGEWYLDSTAGYVYYMPRANENMEKASVMLPMLDNDRQYLVSVKGTESESVQNLKFENVAFSHTTWNRPNTAVGHVAAQDNLLSDYYKDASSDRYPQERLRSIESAIEIQNAENISFEGCEFSKLGGNGIRIFWNVQNCDIRGCEFFDIASSALQIADYNTEDETKHGKLQYEANINGITVSDNYIHHTGREFWSAAAISVAYARDVLVEHNEICYTPYSGMHIGIGWEAPASYEPYDLTIDVKNNYLHDIFCYGKIYDGAPIYTNGLTGGTAENPNEISGNYITDVGPGAASIYNDEGSTYYYVHDNVMDTRNTWSEYEEVLDVVRGTALTQNINITANVRSHGLTWKNNYVATRGAKVQEKAYLDPTNDIDNCIQIGASGDWCDEAKEIIATAGIRDEYKDNSRSGLRKLSLIDSIELEIGETITLTPAMLTTKSDAYKNNSLRITAISSDDTIVSVDGDRITGEDSGIATITYEVVENGVLYTAELEVSVAMEEDYIEDLSAYRMSFENGGSLRLMKPNVGYFNVQEASATTNGSETFQIVANPKGSGKVVKLDLVGSLTGDGSSIALSVNTASNSTGEARATLKPGETITYTFKYYWAQAMSADNNPAFCVYNATGKVFAGGTSFKTEANKWHKAVLTYTNDTDADILLGNAQIRFCAPNNPAKTWTVAGHSGYVKGGTSDFGARTVYIDSVTATIK